MKVHKLKCKKKYGNWYYRIEKWLDLEFDVYVLWNEEETDGGEFGCYHDMKYYVEERNNFRIN